MSGDPESLFNLSEAPRLRTVRDGAAGNKVRPVSTHFVPKRFEDKVKYMQNIERNRAAFLKERRRQLELLELGLASAEVRAAVMGRRAAVPETAAQKDARRKREAAASREENRLWRAYELHEDRTRLNAGFERGHRKRDFLRAARFAEEYVQKSSEWDLEAALRQKVVACRALASASKKSSVWRATQTGAKDGGNRYVKRGSGLVHHSVESARQLDNDAVVSPKFGPQNDAKLSPNKSPYLEEQRMSSMRKPTRRQPHTQNRRIYRLGRQQEHSPHLEWIPDNLKMGRANPRPASSSGTSLCTDKPTNQDKRPQLLLTPLPLSSPTIMISNGSDESFGVSPMRHNVRARYANKRTRAANDRLRQSKALSELALRDAQTSLGRFRLGANKSKN